MMEEELAIELLKNAWNFNITAIILVAIIGGFLILSSALWIRNMDDNVITKYFSYGLTVGSLIVFGIAGYFAFGSFYL